MSNDPPRATSDAPSTLTIVRLFDAPIQLVYDAWTIGEHLNRWSCPQGLQIVEGFNELRIGGRWGVTMQAPDGQRHRAGGRYLAIKPPTLLEFTHSWQGEDKRPGPETIVRVQLSRRGNQTEMRFTQTGFSSTESRDGHREGWNSAFESLLKYLSNSQFGA